MPGRISVDVLAVELHGTKRLDPLRGLGWVFDHDVQVHLLRNSRVGPGRRPVVRCQLEREPRVPLTGRHDYPVLAAVRDWLPEQGGVELSEPVRVWAVHHHMVHPADHHHAPRDSRGLFRLAARRLLYRLLMLTPAQRRTLDEVDSELARLIRYDDESLVHEKWIRQRYDCGCYPTFGPARKAAVRTAWHEAGHAVAALATGARFSSASIHHGRDTEGRVHRIRSVTPASYVIDAGGQIAERLMDWTMLEQDDQLARWLAGWRADGGDARRFRSAVIRVSGLTTASAWRQSEQVLTPLRPSIRTVARALLVHPAYLPYPVVAALAQVAPEPGSA